MRKLLARCLSVVGLLQRSGVVSASVRPDSRLAGVITQRFERFLRLRLREPRSPAASVLVGLLWCLALLSVVVIGVLHTARMDLLVVKNYGDRIQAHYLALAGIEKAKALLYQDARLRSRSRQNHSGNLYDNAGQLRDMPLGRGLFRVIRRGRQDESGGIRYGVSDEESRLNVNLATADALGKLNQMTSDVVAAIMDWRDADNVVTPGGSEAEYYLGLQPPYQPRNGPVETIRELLMVRGVSRELLFGRDVHQNGLLRTAGETGDDVLAGDLSSDLDLGWAGNLTVDSSVRNVNAAGDSRVNIQTADETDLTSVRGITSDIAKAIIAYRGQKQLESIADLLDVTAARNQGSPVPPTTPSPRQPGSSQSRGQPSSGSTSSTPPSGPTVISEDLLLEIADDVTTETGLDLPGVININTAGLDVLACLPGVNRELAQAIISFRQSNGFMPNIAWLLRVPGLTRDIFKQVAPLVSARSETYRILSEGKISSTGTRQRIQVIVHVGLHDIDMLSYREDDL